jgi:hypothetical protein
MNKPPNEPIAEGRRHYGNQLRYIGQRRFRKLRARARRQGVAFEYRVYNDVNGGQFRSWLRPL